MIRIVIVQKYIYIYSRIIETNIHRSYYGPPKVVVILGTLKLNREVEEKIEEGKKVTPQVYTFYCTDKKVKAKQMVLLK